MTTVSSMTTEELLKDMDRLVIALPIGAAREAIAELARRLRQAEADLRTVTAERDASERLLLNIWTPRHQSCAFDPDRVVVAAARSRQGDKT